MHRNPARPFQDRPWRRIGLAATVAVLLHGLLLGIGAYYFKDTLGVYPPKPRLTQQKLEQAVADATFHTPVVADISGSGLVGEENSVQREAWINTPFREPAWTWWSWQASSHLTATRVAAPPTPKKRENPGSNISQP